MNHSLECAREDVVHAAYLITAIFIVHNFLIDESDDTVINVAKNGVVEGGDQNGDTYEEEQGDEGIKTRDILFRHMQWREFTRGSEED